MVFGNGVKNIQAAAYNGARTVDSETVLCLNQKSGFVRWLCWSQFMRK